MTVGTMLADDGAVEGVVFTTFGSETFTIHPGDVLLAVDHTRSVHKWRLVKDEPWNRAYVAFKKGAYNHFISDQT